MSIGNVIQLAWHGTFLLALGCSSDHSNELITQLEDADVQVRRAAVRTLREHQGERVIAALGGAIEDTDTEVRRLAIHALGIQNRSRLLKCRVLRRRYKTINC